MAGAGGSVTVAINLMRMALAFLDKAERISRRYDFSTPSTRR